MPNARKHKTFVIKAPPEVLFLNVSGLTDSFTLRFLLRNWSLVLVL